MLVQPALDVDGQPAAAALLLGDHRARPVGLTLDRDLECLHCALLLLWAGSSMIRHAWGRRHT
jgi:hypothetical protein